MALAPEIASFGDESHDEGETGLTIDGGGFGAFPGSAWIYQNPDRSGVSDQLTVAAWNDVQLSGVAIPASPNNGAGTVYLFVQREDLAWSEGLAFTLSTGDEDDAYPSVGRSITLPGGGIWVVDPDSPDFCEIVWDLPAGVTLQSVAYDLPDGLTNDGAAVDTTLGKSALKVGGATHGMMRQVQAVATLSNGSRRQCTAPLRCFNGC